MPDPESGPLEDPDGERACQGAPGSGDVGTARPTADSGPQRDSVVALLEPAYFDVRLTGDGREALRWLTAGSYDLAMLDIQADEWSDTCQVWGSWPGPQKPGP